MTHWYIGGERELLIDVDRWDTRLRNGYKWGEFLCRQRLRNAERSGKFVIERVWRVPTYQMGHYHVYVLLRDPLPVGTRISWQNWLGNDVLRGHSDHMRVENGHPFPTLLWESKKVPGYWRQPDRQCDCAGKHNTDENPNCPVFLELRGASPHELFGTWDNNEEAEIALPWDGEIPISLIRRRVTKSVKKTVEIVNN